MFSKFKKIFKLSNWKRWAISSISLCSMLLAITFGSIYSVNNKSDINYKSGAEVVLKVTESEEDEEILKRQIEQRLILSSETDATYSVTINSNNFFTITGTNVNTDKEMEEFKNFIFNKNKITVTKLGVDHNYKYEEIKEISFKDAQMSNGNISLIIDKSISYDSDVLIWKNLDSLISLAQSEYNDEWTSNSVGQDPYKFLFIDGRTEDTEEGIKAILKTKDNGGFEAVDYLISKNSGTELAGESVALNFSFAKNITLRQKEKIFYNLDFSVSSYNLNLQTYNFIKPKLGSNAYQFLIIAAAVAFSFISIFLIVNYGLLGALSTICAAFLVFLGLLMITVFRGEYSPESVAAIIVAVGIGLDFNIVFFERMKKELKIGNSLQKSLKKADKLTFQSSLTKAFALIITSVTIYIIGSLYLGTFSSLILILSISITLIMFILIRILANLIIGTKFFDDKLNWLGIYKKIEKEKLNATKINDLNKKTEELIIEDQETIPHRFSDKTLALGKKISVITLGVIAASAVALFATFSLIGSNWTSGLKSDGSITQPTILKSTERLEEKNLEKVKKILSNKLDINQNQIHSMLVDKERKEYLLEISTTKIIEEKTILEINVLLNEYNIQLINYSLIADVANKSIVSILYIALASIIAMTIFVLIRSDWTYGITMFLSLTISLFLFISLFAFQIFTFNLFFIFTLCSAILITVSNNISVLFRIKEKLKNKKMEELTKLDLKKISNISVMDSLKRLFVSNGIMLGILLIFAFFPGSISIFYTIPLMIFILISLVVSCVLLPFFFTLFKAFSCKRKRNKIINHYWETEIIQEQIFPGINDIK